MDFKLKQASDGFDIDVDNKGGVQTTEAVNNYILSNLLCFARMPAQRVKSPEYRLGHISEFLNQRVMFSLAGIELVENTSRDLVIENIKNEFSQSIERDYNAGLINTKPYISSIEKINEGLKINIINQSQQISFILNAN